ncbi:hypothetical protein DAPPUDRAFT_241304 [Daphnia pulex]|uniref:Uncharacterized protein n=1 Tax=Daphnia pulex TaxID=6669 RepID=E9GDX7_DAPPU|nr:hypothetical protein DAPPUDRAFT_241304 [Daphnia pulex]|eukprot:EFX82164.1 hypothetical protein DAPPUDRAFT_241304 [Daphnia pulex]
MKSILISIVILMMWIDPSVCIWGKAKSSSNNNKAVMSSGEIPAEHRSGKSSDDMFVMLDDQAAEYEGSIEGGETLISNGTTEEEERLFNKFPLHVFLKKKHPFVTLSTMTKTSTVTAVITSSTVGLCAQLVNVTGPCRLRKGLWVDEPIVLSFDDEMDSIDDTLLSPSQTSKMETTAVPEPIAQISDEIAGRNDESQILDNNRRISVRSGSVIHSSKNDEESRDNSEQVNEGRFGFFGLKNKLKKKVKLVTVVTTTAVTVTSTSTYYKTVSTKSFFIQVCTPSPFPFNVCDGRKKRQVEIESPSWPSIKSQIKIIVATITP